MDANSISNNAKWAFFVSAGACHKLENVKNYCVLQKLTFPTTKNLSQWTNDPQGSLQVIQNGNYQAKYTIENAIGKYMMHKYMMMHNLESCTFSLFIHPIIFLYHMLQVMVSA